MIIFIMATNTNRATKYIIGSAIKKLGNSFNTHVKNGVITCITYPL